MVLKNWILKRKKLDLYVVQLKNLTHEGKSN